MALAFITAVPFHDPCCHVIASPFLLLHLWLQSLLLLLVLLSASGFTVDDAVSEKCCHPMAAESIVFSRLISVSLYLLSKVYVHVDSRTMGVGGYDR
jgi:hypothetical protein